MIFLSYILDGDTPTYGNRNKFEVVKKSSIDNGNVANDSFISTTVHIGTHIDMPYHFHKDGQTIEDFDEEFWKFNEPLFINIEAKNKIICSELLSKLDLIGDIGYDILIVKTGICEDRGRDVFWQENYGFSPKVYDYLVEKFPRIKILGFDSISVSSFKHRDIGRESHKKFLNPNNPILLLEDMDLRKINDNYPLEKIIVAPLRIAKCDGLPCTVIAFSSDDL